MVDTTYENVQKKYRDYFSRKKQQRPMHSSTKQITQSINQSIDQSLKGPIDKSITKSINRANETTDDNE